MIKLRIPLKLQQKGSNSTTRFYFYKYQYVYNYFQAYQDVPYDEGLDEQDRTAASPGSGGVLGPWMTFCKRIGYFFSLFREFAELSSSDQALLLKTAITSACIIMGSVVYDSESGKWPSKGIIRSGYLPNVTSQNVEKFVPSDLFSRVENFFKKFQTVCPDETMAMILILVSLYSPELMGLEARETVQNLQDRYIHVLNRYVRYKFREKSSVMFPKAIVSLADIRELAERTCQMRIQQQSSGMLPNLIPGFSNSQMGSGQSSALVAAGPSSSMAKDFSQVKLEGISSLDREAMAKRARMAATGDSRDMIFQRIMQKFTEQMHHSSINLRAPSSLPFILQIVEKILKASGQNIKSDRAITGGSSSSSSRKEKSHHSVSYLFCHFLLFCFILMNK